jgi:predicted metalloprotease
MRVPGGAVGGLGIGAILVALVAVFLGADPQSLLSLFEASGIEASGPQPSGPTGAPEDEAGQFVSVVLAETEDVWNRLLGGEYEEPTLVLFEDRVASACGFQSAAVGPFYCPMDKKVYLDLGFFRELASRHNAPGDFAAAYVIAHEIGHHVQNLRGISDQVHRAQSRVSQSEANELSVRLELQADFLAGVWAHHAQRGSTGMGDLLEAGDLEEALNAASQIGDDRLQREAQGYVAPDSFTHGTAEQRARWFRRGLETGDLAAGDTFKARDL